MKNRIQVKNDLICKNKCLVFYIFANINFGIEHIDRRIKYYSDYI